MSSAIGRGRESTSMKDLRHNSLLPIKVFNICPVNIRQPRKNQWLGKVGGSNKEEMKKIPKKNFP